MPKELEIIYNDNHLLVVNKPAGIPTQPNGHEIESLEELCKAFVKTSSGKPGNVFLHAIHRLDRPVSGIVVFAKTSKALSRLNLSLRMRETKKIYRAWVSPMPCHDEKKLEHYLLHGEFRAELATEATQGAKCAILHYKVIEKSLKAALIEIELETGRYHQIRAQMAAIGSPIVGDVKYGSKIKGATTIALQHCRFEIPHPITKERLSFAVEAAEWYYGL